MMDSPSRARQSTFKRNAHVAYFRRCLQGMPSKATEGDGNRSVSNLDTRRTVLVG